MASETTIKAYKGFDKNWQCRGYQFEPGKTYVHEGPVKLCAEGFHACEAPLDCLSYYSIFDGNFAEVELSGVTDERENDTKRVGSKITIGAKLSIAGLVSAQIEWVRQNVKGTKEIASGNGSKAASSGNGSKAASSGYGSTAASSGDHSTAASSGDHSKAASSGNGSTAASSGYGSTAASSGDGSTAASSGYGSKAKCDTNGFAAVAGLGGRVGGNKGSALAIGYRGATGVNRFATATVGENGIKENTWYRATERGELIED